jgi:3-deoxy-D-manno-octulosonic-acid transferase
MIVAYRILTIILYPLLFLYLYSRKIIKKEDRLRYKEKILPSYFNIKEKNGSVLIWFHAASIGEFKSIIPIIDQLNIVNINYKFLITTTTLSSGKLAESELERFKNVEHRYFPFDVEFLIDKFIRLWKPDKIFLVDSEIWPNLIFKAKQYKIPLALINARLTVKSYNRWMRFPKIAKKIFGSFNLCICSNFETKKFLENLELKNVFFIGNIKLINKIDILKLRGVNDKFLETNRFWLAASTHKDEDIFCFKTHIDLKKKFKDLITIIAPRHISRAKNIYSLSKELNLSAQVLNNNEAIEANKEIIIINYFGLQNLFKYAKSVFIGKSMIKKLENTSGQNPIEAAKLNCKIYHGPFVYNFKDIYETLEKNNISKKIVSHKELSNNLSLDLKNPLKQNNETPNSIKELELKTMVDTMLIVNNFLKNEIK